jgi:hypothetical protein
MGIENLDQLIFMIKNWPNGTHFRCDGPFKPTYTFHFWKEILLWLKEKKLIQEQDFFEKDSSFDFIWF